ncbi:beta-1,3-galactosyltransferase 1-like isoform X2 [Ptychodera flava]|uniref:beta-1,3-galactosyltransferase 1-like isoform X2 n=1 Tax=Ptychodera flava TaxID=63121 RepID=UPI003969E14B
MVVRRKHNTGLHTLHMHNMKFESLYQRRLMVVFAVFFLCFATPFYYMYDIQSPRQRDIVATMSWFDGNHPPIAEHDVSFVFKQPDACKSKDVFLLNMVLTRTQETSLRSVIRRTWGSVREFNNRKIQTLFVVGRPADGNDDSLAKLSDEAALFKDLIVSDFLDTYENLTLKTISTLQWSDKYCPNATYVLKVDSDMMVNIKKFIPYLEKSPRSNFVAGQLMDSSPWRFHLSKWYITYSEYPYKKYPLYLAGSYVMSSDVVHKLSVTSHNTKAFKFEDVYVGIMLKKNGITPFHSDKFYISTFGLSAKYLKERFVAHAFKEESIPGVWTEIWTS